MNITGAFYALFAFAVFATHDALIKYLGVSYSPFQMIFFSTLFSFPLVTFMLMRDKNEGNLRPVHPWWTLLRTVCASANAMCAFYAFTVLPLAQVYAILFATPLLITIMSIPVLGERVGPHRWAAVFVGLVGVFVVLRPGATELSLGHLAALTCAFVGGMASIIVRKVGSEERTVVLMLYPMVANFVIMGALMAIDYKPMPLGDLGGIGALAMLGFTGGVFLIIAYKASEAAIVAPMQYSQIIWATFFGALFFGESIDLPTILGASIIIASGLYIVFRESKSGTSENTPVLRTRSRASSATSFRVSPFLRRTKLK
ncbi:drug/metabolite transporter (DMT)-like permease [Pacificibacter maritimus]|uniref:Drug/metabolite transporter (DMT)-like permease n=1 Tax=Pacificibacter maritimus TaxID=762213 RepID=A0A3N4U7N3_9RHOB|nr:DMT family transporter [Pacificibacter maritimus]RPE63121.1 drug/metabolite transporter (DMT)-like permease [Pacificibacter maritimus]